LETTVRVEVDGRAVSAETLWSIASGYGHFTAMQIRHGRARGLDLHLERLEAANRELFDADLDRDRIRQLMRHALGETHDASLRVYVFDGHDLPAVMVTVRAPADVTSPQRLQSVRYERPDPHLKHLATGQGFYTRLARRNRFDDSLLTGSQGLVAESATANICFYDGSVFVWPDAPQLHGITMQLLELRLAELGVPSTRARVSIQDVSSFTSAFLTNARGVAVVTCIDDTQLAIDNERLELLGEAYASVAWDRI
jgi:branched-subunit amino acid aminotransferase/4-amino-4-deoxychorismate lyase